MKKKLSLILTSLIIGIIVFTSPAFAEHIDQTVLTFYYGWYSPTMHWEDDPLGNTTYYTPLQGFYSSLDRAIIEQQIDEAKAAGIDGFISSWWYVADELDHFSQQLRTLLEVAEEKDFLISVYIETEWEGTVADQVVYLVDNGYVSSPAWYRKDGKPVFYIWAGVTAEHDGNSNPEDDYWYLTKEEIRREAEIDPYLNAAKFNWAYSYGVDALHLYLIAGDDLRNDGLVTDFLCNVSGINHGDYSITVNPGFQSVGDPPLAERNDGERYRIQWESALNLQDDECYPGYPPDEILITSWNEYHESSIIEPTVEFGKQYLDITSEYTGGCDDCTETGEEPPAEEPPAFECEDGETAPCFISQFRMGTMTCVDGFWDECKRQRRRWGWRR